MPSFETLLYSVEDHIATLTLNRPDKLNAFNPQMLRDMVAALDLTDADDDVRVVIVTGAGRAFCAGADLSGGTEGEGFAYDDSPADGVPRDGGGILTQRIYTSLKPIISACNGAAVGVGISMQLAMDIRLASETARLGFVFSRRGGNMEAASSWFLPRLVGLQTAFEWCYTGRIFPAAEALEKGLVRSVHAPDDLLPAAYALAREIADNCAPVSVAVNRQLMWRMVAAPHPMEAHKADSRAMDVLSRSADVQEGVAAFFEKRPPRFPGRVSRDMPDLWPDWTPPTYR